MTHGERVKVIRNSLGLTLQSFGRPLGVTKTAICNITYRSDGKSHLQAV